MLRRVIKLLKEIDVSGLELLLEELGVDFDLDAGMARNSMPKTEIYIQFLKAQEELGR